MYKGMSKTSIPYRPVWWLWPNVMGWDAAVIALIWQETFARAFTHYIPVAARFALFFAVWALYLLDRRLDAAKLPRVDSAGTDRHRFAGDHPRLFIVLALFSACVAGIAALFLPWIWILMGCALTATITLYFAWVHLPVFPIKPPLVKEVLVAILFTMGVTLSMSVQGATVYPAFWRAAGLFAALCLVNILIIDGFSRTHDKAHRKLRFYCLASLVLSLIAASAIRNHLTLTGLVPAIALSALLISLTGIIARFTSKRFAAIYCDLALFTPLLFLWG